MAVAWLVSEIHGSSGTVSPQLYHRSEIRSSYFCRHAPNFGLLLMLGSFVSPGTSKIWLRFLESVARFCLFRAGNALKAMAKTLHTFSNLLFQISYLTVTLPYLTLLSPYLTLPYLTSP